MLTLVLGATMPAIVLFATNQIKKLKTISLSDHRVLWVRAVVAVLALTGSALTWWIGEGSLDEAMVETAVLAVFNAVVATWLYYKTK